jgi:uncharacterized membrane protein YeaQ/YmgE (transglycosylase-associated protein family)
VERQGWLSRLANGAIGAFVGVYAFLDDLLLGPILIAVTVWVPWYLVFGIAAGVLTFVNIACCAWMQQRWDDWVRGYGAKLEARLEKLRRGRLLKHPLGWIARDSTILLTIAAGLIGTVIVVAVTRLAGSKPVGRRRVLFASVAYSVGFAATYTGVGVAIENLVRIF